METGWKTIGAGHATIVSNPILSTDSNNKNNELATYTNYGIEDPQQFLSDIGKLPHGEGILEALKIWAERNPKYGDGWKNNKEYQMMGLIAEKFRRLESAFENPSTDNIYEVKEEILRDLINWSLYYLSNLKDGNYTKANINNQTRS